MRKIPRAVFIDAAGTLIKTRESVGEVYARHAASFGAAIDPKTTQRIFIDVFTNVTSPFHEDGPSPDDDREWWQNLVKEILTKSGAPDIDHAACFDALYAHYADASAWTLYPDVVPFLTFCKNLTPQPSLGVLSNFDSRLIGILEGLGIRSDFDSLTISSQIGASKPHARIFESALATHKVNPADAIHIGDCPNADWQGAKNAGINVFKLDRPHNSLLDVFPR